MQTNKKINSLLGCKHPLIGAPMYPCSNPELVAAISKAGGIGIIQPISLTYAHGYDFKEGIKYIQKKCENAPIGLNLLIESSSKAYMEKNKKWLEIALECGVKFFITALGNPKWVAERVHEHNGLLFHGATSAKWAQKAVDAGVDGLICVNKTAGGHAGQLGAVELYNELRAITDLPLVCSGGLASKEKITQMLDLGYEGVQLGTRFVASKECSAHLDYKKAIVKAKATDIVLTQKVTGVPVAIIATEEFKRSGIHPSLLGQFLLKNNKTKHLVRLFYSLRSFWQLKKSSKKGKSYKDYFQAGQSVEDIDSVASVAKIIESFGFK